MEYRLPSWYSRKLLLIGIAVLVVISFGALLIASLRSEEQSVPDKVSSPTSQMIAMREAARAYIKTFDRYKSDIDADTRFDIEKLLYNHAHIVGGNDLYTGVIRSESYKMNRAPGGMFDLRMLVDVKPLDITYSVSVVKNKATGGQAGFVIYCAPKSEQINKSVTCIDERGR